MTTEGHLEGAQSVLVFFILGCAVVTLALAPSVSSQGYSLTVRADSASYSGSQPVYLSGAVTPAPALGTAVSLQVFNPQNELVRAGSAPLNSSGEYSFNFTTGGTNWTPGNYEVTATWSPSLNGQVYQSGTTFAYSANGTSSTTSATTTTTSTSSTVRSTTSVTATSSSPSLSSSTTFTSYSNTTGATSPTTSSTSSLSSTLSTSSSTLRTSSFPGQNTTSTTSTTMGTSTSSATGSAPSTQPQFAFLGVKVPGYALLLAVVALGGVALSGIAVFVRRRRRWWK